MKHETSIVEKTTVKSASLLGHICHLGLSKHSENYLSNKFGTTSELLWKIRHDIKPEDFILNRLRRLAKPEQYQAWNCAADLEDFCEINPEQGSSDQSDYAYGNQRYENFTPLTEKQREEIRQILRDVLPDELTYRIICFRYSLEDGKCHPTAETALRLNRKISKVRGLMKKAYFYINGCELFDVI